MNGSKQKRSLNPDLLGKQIFRITPVLLGGSPTDPANKVFLTREEHIQAVRFWNTVIAQHRSQPGS